MSDSVDPERRRALKKIFLASAFLGSAGLFGSSLSPLISKALVSYGFSNSPGGQVFYPSAGSLLSKPANQPTTLFTGSIHSGTSSLQLAVIAGILARNIPQVYLTDSSFVDNSIQQVLTKDFGVTINNTKNTTQLVSLLGPAACGTPARWIRYNPNNGSGSRGQNTAMDQLNAAVTLCGAFNALPVPVGQNPPISAAISPLYDISTWGESVPLYEQVWSLVSGSVTKSWVCINPPSGGSPRLNMIDYMVMSKAFSFQLPLVQFDTSYPSIQTQKNFAAAILNAYPTPCAVLGYIGLGQPGGGSNEVNFVSALSGGSGAANSALSGSSPAAHGGFYYSAAQLTTNMSVQSAYAPFSGPTFPSPAAIPAYSPTQKYIAILASQGDALDWVENVLLNYMLQCQSAAMPIGITMSQVTQSLTPLIVRRYTETITPTSSIVASGSAGAGYNHITDLPTMPQFLATAAQAGANVNVRDFFFIDGPGVNPVSKNGAVAAQYIGGLMNGGMAPRACWWWSPAGSAPMIVNGTPCFFTALNISQTNLSTQAQCNQAVANAIAAAKSNFIVLVLNTTFPTPAYLVNACQQSNNGVANVSPLTPGMFANLFRFANGLPQI